MSVARYRSLLLALALIGLLLMGWLLRRERTAPGIRNAVLITVDTLRPSRMSLYGYERDTTPFLREFFSNRAYRNARASSPCTVPTVKQTLTGRLDSQGPTLAEVLSAAGFSTSAVLSQHQFEQEPIYRRGFEDWDLQSASELDHHGMSLRRAPEVTDRAIRWLESRAAVEARPFFLWVHYFDPHDPYAPPGPDRHFSRDVGSFADGDRRAAQKRAQTDEPHWFLVDHIFDDDDRDALWRLYDDEVRLVDREIGRLISFLEEQELIEQSAILFSADHGERLGENGAWDHCYSVHDLELHVPLALRMPEGIAQLHEASRPASTLDLYPTVTAALGVPTPPGRHGQSLLEPAEQQVAVAAFQRAVVVADESWKLFCVYLDGACEPRGLVELVDGVEYQGRRVPLPEGEEQVRRLSYLLSNRLRAMDRAVESGEKDLERLRTLGYTD